MSIYRKPDIKVRMERIYADKLARWPVDYERKEVGTRYGRTHVLACGPLEAPPLLLLHGLAITSMMWLPNIAALSAEYRCYLIDVIGDYGRSELAHPLLFVRRATDYRDWLVDVLDGLGIERAHMLGASNGGFITLSQAIHAPERVGRIVLLALAGLNLTVKSILPRIFGYLLFSSDARREGLIKWFIGDHPAVRAANYEQLWLGMQGLPRLAVPLRIPDARLKQIEAPALFVFGERDQVILADVGRQRVAKCIPHAQVYTIAGAGHALNCEVGELVCKLVVNFLDNGDV